MHPTIRFLVFFLMLTTPVFVPAKTTLNFSLLVFNGEQRQAYLKQVQAFEALNPDIKVNIQGVESEEYKQNIEKWLQADQHSDVMFWFGGERLNWYVSKGWITPIDDLWLSEDWHNRITQSAQSSVTRNGRIYGLPIHYYHWGIYYRKSLFKKFNLEPPTNWQAFLKVCKTLKQNDITPIALGSSELWPIAGWFDYLNLRLNGLDFHQSLVEGRSHYTDTRLEPVFSHWRVLIEAGYFQKNHADLTWREALPYLYRNLAGMFLMGNFWTSQIPDSIRDDFSVFRFPIMNENMATYEEAPTDVLFIPQNAVNKEAAYKFLRFMSRIEVQQELNESLGMLAPLKTPHQRMDHFVTEGANILQQAEGASQFYDRDNPLPIAVEGMREFSRFINTPHRLPLVIRELEILHKESFPH